MIRPKLRRLEWVAYDNNAGKYEMARNQLVGLTIYHPAPHTPEREFLWTAEFKSGATSGRTRTLEEAREAATQCWESYAYNTLCVLLQPPDALTSDSVREAAETWLSENWPQPMAEAPVFSLAALIHKVLAEEYVREQER